MEYKSWFLFVVALFSSVYADEQYSMASKRLQDIDSEKVEVMKEKGGVINVSSIPALEKAFIAFAAVEERVSIEYYVVSMLDQGEHYHVYFSTVLKKDIMGVHAFLFKVHKTTLEVQRSSLGDHIGG